MSRRTSGKCNCPDQAPAPYRIRSPPAPACPHNGRRIPSRNGPAALSGRRFTSACASSISLSKFSPLHVVRNQLARRHNPVRIQLDRPLTCLVRSLEHRLAAIGVIRVVVATQPQLLPRRRVSRIDLHHMLQHRNRILIRSRIVRQRQAMQVEVIRLGASSAACRYPGTRPPRPAPATTPAVSARNLRLHA